MPHKNQYLLTDITGDMMNIKYINHLYLSIHLRGKEFETVFLFYLCIKYLIYKSIFNIFVINNIL